MTRLLNLAMRRTSLAPLLADLAGSGPQFLGHMLWLRQTQWYSPERLKQIQERRLHMLVAHAAAQSPFYRERFRSRGIEPRDIRGLHDLERLPILRREDILNSLSEITAANASAFRPTLAKTSGTSGMRMEFLRDRTAASIGNAARWRFRGWHGIGFRHRIANIRSFGPSTGRSGAGGAVGYGPGLSTLRINLYQVKPGAANLEAVADELSRFRPDAITTSSPTWLAFFSAYLAEHSSRYRIRPKVVFCGGERVFPNQRTAISEAFEAPVVNIYGNWEYVLFAGECPRGRMHIASEIGIVEILRDGKRVAPGESGELVVTGLWNRSLPFIRYAIGDMASLDTDACPCGRGLPTWQIVGGRERNLLATPHGLHHAPQVLYSSPRWQRKILGVRFCQDTPDAVLVQVVRGPAFGEEDVQPMRDELVRELGSQMKISIEFCDTIEQTQGGKFQYVASSVR
jgi:phenylacetate-coenzyme A ligase PaaK-like adenylate-forming protein